MAHFELIDAPPGNGKSLYCASKTRDLVDRNIKWYKKTGIVRQVYANIKFSDAFEEYCKFDGQNFLAYWSDTQQICNLRDIDLIWDEIATELDARNFSNLTVELKRFLSQYRKRGVDIYANTQDYSMLDARARLMVTRVKTLTKFVGSRDPSPTKPPVKRIWGLIFVRDLLNYKETDPEKKQYAWLPGIFLIEKELVDMYDTRQDIPLGRPAPLKHIELCCEFYDTPGHVCYQNNIKGKIIRHQ